MARIPRSLAVLALVSPLLAGCAAGLDSTSLRPYSAADGVNAGSGDLRLINALVVAPEGSTSGILIMGVANKGERDDRVTGITSPAATVELDGPVELPAGGSVSIGGEGGPTATVTGLTKSPGEAVTVKVSFSRGSPVTVRTVVQPAAGDYESVTPPAPTPAVAPATPAPTASPSTS